MTEVRQNDLAAAKGQFKVIESIEENCEQLAEADYVTVTYYYMPEADYHYATSDLIFRQSEMRELWKRGQEHVNKKMEEPQLSKLRLQVRIPRAQLCSGEIFADR